MKLVYDKIKTLIEQNAGGQYKNIFIGDPFHIAEVYYPCVIINPIKTEIIQNDNLRDLFTYNIDISIILDIRNYLEENDKNPSGFEKLVEYMEGEDSNGNLLSTLMIKIFRDNVVLDSLTNMIILPDNEIEYLLNERSEDLTTVESILHLKINQIKDA